MHIGSEELLKEALCWLFLIFIAQPWAESRPSNWEDVKSNWLLFGFWLFMGVVFLNAAVQLISRSVILERLM